MGSSFGGGTLQDYLINSNTSADGFLACLQDNVENVKKRARSPEKKKEKPAKKDRSLTLSPKR